MLPEKDLNNVHNHIYCVSQNASVKNNACEDIDERKKESEQKLYEIQKLVKQVIGEKSLFLQYHLSLYNYCTVRLPQWFQQIRSETLNQSKRMIISIERKKQAKYLKDMGMKTEETDYLYTIQPSLDDCNLKINSFLKTIEECCKEFQMVSTEFIDNDILPYYNKVNEYLDTITTLIYQIIGNQVIDEPYYYNNNKFLFMSSLSKNVSLNKNGVEFDLLIPESEYTIQWANFGQSLTLFKNICVLENIKDNKSINYFANYCEEANSSHMCSERVKRYINCVSEYRSNTGLNKQSDPGIFPLFQQLIDVQSNEMQFNLKEYVIRAIKFLSNLSADSSLRTKFMSQFFQCQEYIPDAVVYNLYKFIYPLVPTVIIGLLPKLFELYDNENQFSVKFISFFCFFIYSFNDELNIDNHEFQSHLRLLLYSRDLKWEKYFWENCSHGNLKRAGYIYFLT